MKARFTFYFAAVVALVLFLACMQSHATERRDPLIIQDTPTTQAARSSSLVRATGTLPRADQKTPHKAKTDKNHTSNVPAEAKNKSGANPKTQDADQNTVSLPDGGPSGHSSR